MTEPITLNVTLDLDRVLMGRPIHDRDGDIVDTGPTTLEDIVLDRVAHLLLERVDRDDRDDLRRRVQTISAEEIVALVRPQVEAALTESITLTNAYGEPTGGTTTLREIIVKNAMEWLTKPRGASYSNKVSPLAELISEQVDKAMKAEMSDAIKEAKVQALAAVKAKGAEFLAAAVDGMIR